MRRRSRKKRTADAEHHDRKPVGERTSGRANPPLRAFTPGEAIRHKLRKLEERIGPDVLDRQSRAMLEEIYDALENLEV